MAGPSFRQDWAGICRDGPAPHWGGPVAGRTFCCPALAVVAAVALVPGASAADILRLSPPADGSTPLAVWADDVYTWQDGTEQFFTVGGSVLIQQDHNSVWCSRAVIWVDADAHRKRKPIRVCIYADDGAGKPVGLEVKGRPRQEVPAVVLEFTTPGFGWIRGKEVRESLAHTPLYQKALAARGRPPGPAAPPAKKAAEAAVHPVQFVRPGTSVELLQPDPGIPKTPVGPGDPRPGPEPAATG